MKSLVRSVLRRLFKTKIPPIDIPEADASRMVGFTPNWLDPKENIKFCCKTQDDHRS